MIVETLVNVTEDRMRYRRQDEIGTPFCVTYDFESENDGAVTIRDRDTMEQVRVKIDELDAYFADKFTF